MMTIEHLLNNQIPDAEIAPSHTHITNLKAHLFEQLMGHDEVKQKAQIILERWGEDCN